MEREPAVDGRPTLVCPLCGQRFPGDVPENALCLIGRESDLRPVFLDSEGRLDGDGDLHLHLVQSCPNCLFTAYLPTFGYQAPEFMKLLKKLHEIPGGRPVPAYVISHPPSPSLRQSIQRAMAGMAQRATLPAPVNAYVMASKCHDMVTSSKDDGRLIDYFMRAMWTARHLGDAKAASFFAPALKALLLNEGSALSTAEPERFRYAYLRGELCRLTGDFSSAVLLFAAMSEQRISPEAPWAGDMEFYQRQARRMMALAMSECAIVSRIVDLEELEQVAKLEEAMGELMADSEEADGASGIPGDPPHPEEDGDETDGEGPKDDYVDPSLMESEAWGNPDVQASCELDSKGDEGGEGEESDEEDFYGGRMN